MNCKKPLTPTHLRYENSAYSASGGTSEHCRTAGFVPAFFDPATNRIVRSRYANGTPAPMHVLDGLPGEWVLNRASDGHVTAIRPSVVAGFLLNGKFYTRSEAAQLVASIAAA